ncbi:MAG: SDR family NAD(P)-dependent oxidoreductase [Candidatus Nanoarchaeia archaeon]|nr:SDR family NAD(P)-dependent oxidoreductase [Candidatus Nanoarchaeia archaeon]
MTNYLVTGGAGFIGSNLVDELIKRGYNVITIDNFDDYYSEDYKLKNLNPKAKLYKGDITNYEFLKVVFDENKIDGVFHLAAKAGVRASVEKPGEYFNANVVGTANLLKLCSERKIKVVFASSSSVYGEVEYIPTDENHPKNPISPYALSKLHAEQLCEFYMNQYDFPVAWTRFYTVYGPRGRPDMAIAKFTKAVLKGEPIEIYGNGEQLRDFTYVSDIVQGLTKVMQLGARGCFNLGTSQKVSVNDLVKYIEEIANRKANVIYTDKKEGDVSRTMADITKARELVGYNPEYTIQSGIKEYMSWFVKNSD